MVRMVRISWIAMNYRLSIAELLAWSASFGALCVIGLALFPPMFAIVAVIGWIGGTLAVLKAMKAAHAAEYAITFGVIFNTVQSYLIRPSASSHPVNRNLFVVDVMVGIGCGLIGGAVVWVIALGMAKAMAALMGVYVSYEKRRSGRREA
jgi:hypothetical protein